MYVMMTDFSETLGRLHRVQQLLQLLLDDAAELLAEQSDEENDQWVAEIVDKMLANLREQFRVEEQGGYLVEVLEQYPEWHPQVQHLQQEHRLLEGQLGEITARMRRQRLSGRLSPECRRQLQDWITWYRQHQHRETALVQEAFVLEVGEGE